MIRSEFNNSKYMATNSCFFLCRATFIYATVSFALQSVFTLMSTLPLPDVRSCIVIIPSLDVRPCIVIYSDDRD